MKNNNKGRGCCELIHERLYLACGKEELGWLKELKETQHEWLGQQRKQYEGWEERKLEE